MSIGTRVGFCFLTAVALTPAAVAGVEFDGRLPIGRGKLVYGDSQRFPFEAGWFLRQFPGVLYVDPLLGTLRYYSPYETIQLFRPGERGEFTLAEVALRFIHRNREVFGCGAGELSWPPFEVPVDGGNILLVFRERIGSVPIAGATIRMVVRGTWDRGYGELKSIKGFTLRDPSGGEYVHGSLQAFSGLRIFERAFIRGDANQDLKVNLSDAVTILDHLFNGRSDERCLDAMDSDRDRAAGVTDAVYLLLYSFLGGTPPPAAFPRLRPRRRARRGGDLLPGVSLPVAGSGRLLVG